MIRFTIALIALIAFSLPAHARKHHHRHHHYHHRHIDRVPVIASQHGNDPRPHAWCGWWLRQQLGVADTAYNLARNWSHFGSPAGGPAIGAIVVFWHHVGLITARTGSGWVIKSGNDGHAVRERERSLRGAIAFRWPSRMVDPRPLASAGRRRALS
jgi:hypothetical protein